MKMQVLYTEKKEGKQGNPEIVAEQISRDFKCKGDRIPPAYPCEKERLVVIIYENYGSLDKKLIAFCEDLDKTRAENVALIFLNKDGSSDAGDLKAIFNKHGVAISGVLGLEVKKGLFGAAKVTDEQCKKAVKFAEDQVKALFDTAL